MAARNTPNRRFKLRYALRSGARDTVTATQVLGVLYLAGALLATFSIVLPHPREANDEAILTIAALATVVGAISLKWPEHARPWMVNAALAAGTALVSLCIYFAGEATGIYSPMFIWVVLLAASFLPRRAVALHVGWIAVSWGIALALVEEWSDLSAVTRWVLGTFVLTVTAAVMTEIVKGRKLTDERLRDTAHLANHDPLTGIANRRLLETTLERELARARRHLAPLALVALDLDDFKGYNDRHGHAAGDQLLKSASAGWARVLRTEDLIARVGGDEFVALLTACPPAEAGRAAERLLGTLPAGCECSVGVASWDGSESAERLLMRADEALYEKKHLRNGARDVRRP